MTTPPKFVVHEGDGGVLSSVQAQSADLTASSMLEEPGAEETEDDDLFGGAGIVGGVLGERKS